MMRQLRENTKIVLWIVVVAFLVTIFAVWGLDLQTGGPTGNPDVLGRVNGVTITRADYQFIYEQFAAQMRASNQNQALNYTQQRFVETQAWDNLVYGILTDQEIDRLGIEVSNDEIVSFLRNTPPGEIRQYFLDENGQFDNAGYQAALNNPEIDWTNLEQLARERIPRLKLNEYLSAQVHVSEAEVQRAYESEAIELVVEYVRFPIVDADIGDYVPSDEEVAAYYEAHKTDFEVGEKVRVETISIDFVPGPDDLEAARFYATEIVGNLKDGEEFSVLAKTYSEAPTSYVDGNTGFITETMRERVVFDALTAMDIGAVSEPIKTEQGYYIVKALERRTSDEGDTEVSAQEILIKPALSRQTSDSLYALANTVRDRAAEVGLETAAGEHGLELLRPEPFGESEPIDQLGFAPELNNFAMSAAVGETSNVLRDEEKIHLANVVEKLPASTRALDEVAEGIRAELLIDRKRDVAHRAAKGFHTGARRPDVEFAATASEYNVELHQSEAFKAIDNLDTFGPMSAVAEAALVVDAGSVAPPVEADNAWVVTKVVSRSDFDPDDYKARFASIRETLRGAKVQQYVTYWYETVKDESEIEDFRTVAASS